MKVLVVSECFPPAWSWGGPTRSIWNLCRSLVDAGAEVRVQTTDADPALRLDVPARRVEQGIAIDTHRVPRWLGRRLRRYALAPGLPRAVRAAAGWAELGVLQGVWTWPLLVAPRACRRAGLPYVICPRGTYERLSLSEKAGRKRLYRRLVEGPNVAGAAAVQFDSEGEQAASAGMLGGTPGFVHLNGIDFAPRVDRSGDWLRQELALPADARLLGLAGRLHPRKGFQVILPALAAASARFHLVSFGADEAGYRQVLERTAEGCGVRSRLHFLGLLSGARLERVYASLDLLVLPSSGESFGNVIVEALSQGTEVMISDRVPLHEYVERQGLGRVVRSLAPADWAAALELWERGGRPFDGARAATLVRRQFDLAACGGRLLEQYRAWARPAPRSAP